MGDRVAAYAAAAADVVDAAAWVVQAVVGTKESGVQNSVRYYDFAVAHRTTPASMYVVGLSSGDENMQAAVAAI
jgi:hypothetical protein